MKRPLSLHASRLVAFSSAAQQEAALPLVSSSTHSSLRILLWTPAAAAEESIQTPSRFPANPRSLNATQVFVELTSDLARIRARASGYAGEDSTLPRLTSCA